VAIFTLDVGERALPVAKRVPASARATPVKKAQAQREPAGALDWETF
jgi:hypothetical protein